MAIGERILALLKKRGLLSLILLSKSLKAEGELVSLKGSRGFILDAQEDTYLLAVDDQLIALRHGKLEPVLKAHSPANFFWHAARKDDSIYVQEYRRSPTGIWLSTKDYRDWHLLATNIQLDKESKHFHNLAYDPFRGWLITTLGDGNTVRVMVSKDDGKTWQPLYKGSWQFVPIVVLKDRIVFGMDSGIARGGVAVHYPWKDMWELIFLRWLDKRVRFTQMCDLKLLDNGLWIAALGSPQAIVVSKDLKTWYPIRVEGFDVGFNFYMTISEGTGIVACSTGKALLAFKRGELENPMFSARPVIISYKACVDRLKGLARDLIVNRKLLKHD